MSGHVIGEACLMVPWAGAINEQAVHFGSGQKGED